MFFKLIGIENDHPVSKEKDPGFLFLIQRAALLGLKEAGHLNEMQFRHADETLLRQYRADLKTICSGAGKND